jgi:formyl-CoA transferase
LRRQQTGLGGKMDVSMLDSLASLLAFNSGVYFSTGESPKRHGSAHPTISPYEPFEAEDGWINIGVTNDKFWKLFCDVIKCPELLVDPRFAGAPDRVINRVALKEILEPVIRTKSRQHWQTSLELAGVPVGAIKTVGEVCETPQLMERGMLRTVDHPEAGELRYIASAVRFNDQPPPNAMRPPMLGEHNRDVLEDWLGLAGPVIEQYERNGAFGVCEPDNKVGTNQ